MSHIFKKKYSIVIALGIYISILLFGCSIPTPSGVMTHTPTPSLTPTCIPESLSTPDGWDVSSRLLVILYDPRISQDGILRFENREETQDIPLFIQRIAPKLILPGDQLVIFQLGYSIYEAAQVARIFSYTTLPPLYNTPSPKPTITLIPEPTLEGGFGPVQATNIARVQQTERASIESEIESYNNCQKVNWNTQVGEMADIWNVTATAEVNDIIVRLDSDFSRFRENNTSIEEPFRTNELYYGGLYDGLSFATRIFLSPDAGCNSYTTCTLIIIDDLSAWGENNPNNLPINLSDLDVYLIMPNCRDIDNTSCQEARDYWNIEFESLGLVTEPQYWNGDRAEINLLEAIRR